MTITTDLPQGAPVLDEAAFDRAARDCGPRLLRTARMLVGDDALAQDLVQTALAVVWVKRGTVRDPAAVEGFARTVMARRASACWRRRWNAERPTAELPDRPVVTADLAGDLAVRDALARLSRRERSVLVLRYFEDLSIEATAEALGVPTTTVTAAARHGLDRLRSMSWEGFTS